MHNINTNKHFCYYMNAGDASGETALNAFDRAMINSGCANYNLIKVSSILPACAEEMDYIELKEGSLLPSAYACLIAGPHDHVGDTISAAVAVGIPKDSSCVGVIMEYEGVCQEISARGKVLSMVETAMNDRGIAEYTTKCISSSCISLNEVFNCVFAFLAVFEKQ